jgi:hypothetical protein
MSKFLSNTEVAVETTVPPVHVPVQCDYKKGHIGYPADDGLLQNVWCLTINSHIRQFETDNVNYMAVYIFLSRLRGTVAPHNVGWNLSHNKKSEKVDSATIASPGKSLRICIPLVLYMWGISGLRTCLCMQIQTDISWNHLVPAKSAHHIETNFSQALGVVV